MLRPSRQRVNACDFFTIVHIYLQLSLAGMNTTAGSYALLGSVVADDAFIVKRLREAGAIMLGK